MTIDGKSLTILATTTKPIIEYITNPFWSIRCTYWSIAVILLSNFSFNVCDYFLVDEIFKSGVVPFTFLYSLPVLFYCS